MTTEQELKEKLARWAGLCVHEWEFNADGDPCISYCKICGVANYSYDFETRTYNPINGLPDLPHSLDACFRWLVPLACSRLGVRHLGFNYNDHTVDLWDHYGCCMAVGESNRDTEWEPDALCRAIEQLIDKEVKE